MDTLRLQCLGVCLVFVAIAATGLHAHSPTFVPQTPLGTAESADTLEQSVQAGSVLITALPAPTDTSSAAYEIIQAPALSWLVDRSFFWDTRSTDAGSHEVVFRRTVNARTDTLVLAITLTQ